MSTEKIEVNGSYIDKNYFEENLQEALGYLWKKTDSNNILNHHHCILCNMALNNEYDGPVWQSGNLWLCEYCHNKFIVNNDKK